MSSETPGSGSIGPTVSLSDVTLPAAVGDGFARLYSTDERPETVAGWVAGVRAVIERERDRAPTVDDLCTAEDGDHAFVGADETRTYICVLDPLVVPFLTGETGTVQSTTPVRGATVEFDVRPGGVGVSHDDAVVSIGVSDGVADQVSVSEIYRSVCPFIQTFEDAAEYETWAADVEAATTAVSAAESVAIARELADVLFDGERTPPAADDSTDAESESPRCDCC